jgi:beta-lactamase superfamily II metal-dependent hydrolase
MGSAGTIPQSRLGVPGRIPLRPDDLVIYVLNVGDGDAMVIQFPELHGERSFAVVDSNDGGKSLALLRNLGAHHLRFVCATHPHIDHFRGLRRILTEFEGRVREFWDSGFRYTAETYKELVREIGRQADSGTLQFIRPTAGYEHFVANSRVTVLSPSVALRNRFDTYGVDINNASIVLRLEYPVSDPRFDFEGPIPVDEAADEPDGERDDDVRPDAGPPSDERATRTRAVILGGDAQTDAWGQVEIDFQQLLRDRRAWARAIGVRTGRQPLFCDVLKVSHHGSKRGVNLELLQRMGDQGSGSGKGPRYMIVSCASDEDSDHGFPHIVTQAIMREVRDPQAKGGRPHRSDDALGIHYTSHRIAGDPPAPAGSIAVVMGVNAAVPVLYRFGDAVRDPVDLGSARKVLR